MKNSSFFTPVTLGKHRLKNRIMLPPLTRQRSSQPGNVANELMAEYYQQRAGAGLLVTEGTQIEPRGQGYAWTPGIHTAEQIAGWRKVTEAVHAKDGVIFAQLWHVGRVSHTALQPDGAAPVSASAIATDRVSVFIETGPGTGELVTPSAPRALSTAEVEELVQLYIQAARNAMEAGFDGVELHCANGYLVNQFISAHSNHRDDQYGGSLHNRLRFLREIVAGVAECIGKEKVGVRFAPLFTSTDEARTYLGLVEEDPHATYIEAIKVLENAGIAYLSIAEADWDNAPPMPEAFRRDVRATFSGAIIYAGRYTAQSGAQLLDSGLADLVAFGRPFIANPDLPARIANDWPLNPLNPATMYGGNAEGYVDYPLYSA
ncbi:MAG: alkene reductase [Gammaproteobacteria bacterium]|nr:alkene reductase [Gammaproteobacteria bacterium]MBU1490101.1 alkene reductase [Gammaproteobacteria bacterium]MBU2066852.1 alkene reductase [Gammaproteobacteria bacterium]MBU2139532.1 alkene reductase [Gammaproteobacteria bacterium]MBU2216967.1 alkene reductase [Gammaproteobacteria bacterium]